MSSSDANKYLSSNDIFVDDALINATDCKRPCFWRRKQWSWNSWWLKGVRDSNYVPPVYFIEITILILV